jgi:hypothetical protein
VVATCVDTGEGAALLGEKLEGVDFAQRCTDKKADGGEFYESLDRCVRGRVKELPSPSRVITPNSRQVAFSAVAAGCVDFLKTALERLDSLLSAERSWWCMTAGPWGFH